MQLNRNEVLHHRDLYIVITIFIELCNTLSSTLQKSFKTRTTTKQTQQPTLHKTVSGFAKLTALPGAPKPRQTVDTKPEPQKTTVVEKVGIDKAQGVKKQLQTKNVGAIKMNKTEQEQRLKATKNDTSQSTTDNQEEMDTDRSSAIDQIEMVELAKKGRVRTLTPQSMDVTEMASEIQRKLQLVEDVDEEDKENPLFCAEYVQDIYRYLHKLEVRDVFRRVQKIKYIRSVGGYTALEMRLVL